MTGLPVPAVDIDPRLHDLPDAQHIARGHPKTCLVLGRGSRVCFIANIARQTVMKVIGRPMDIYLVEALQLELRNYPA